MNQRNFNQFTSVLFTAIFVVHALRLFYGWGAGINGWEAPMWLSWVALFVSGFLAWTAYKLSR